VQTTTTRPLWLAAALALAAIVPAQAARPLVTDDAGIIEAGHCELEGGRAIERGGADGKTGISSAVFACGIGLATQIGVGLQSARGPEGGLRGSGLGGKTEVWSGEGDRAPALTIGWAVDWTRADGEGTKLDASLVRLVGTLPISGASGHLNLGHTRDHPADRGSTIWGLALEGDPIAAGPIQWQPMVETFGTDRRESWASAGLRFTLLPERVFVDIAYALRFDAEKTRALNAGFRLAF
jgi:hypothetical protein